MKTATIILFTILFTTTATSQEVELGKANRKALAKLIFDRLVISNYHGDKGRPLSTNDLGLYTIGAVRHSEKQISVQRSSSVRISMDNGRSFITVKSNGKVSQVMADQTAIEASDINPVIDYGRLKKSIEEAIKEIIEDRKDDKADPFNGYNSGESKIKSIEIDKTVKLVFRVKINELATKLDDANPWSTVSVEWALIAEGEKMKDFLGFN